MMGQEKDKVPEEDQPENKPQGLDMDIQVFPPVSSLIENQCLVLPLSATNHEM